MRHILTSFVTLDWAIVLALLASYVAVIAERRSAVAATVPHQGDIRFVAHRMARGAAHTSLLSRISDRLDGKPGDRR